MKTQSFKGHWLSRNQQHLFWKVSLVDFNLTGGFQKTTSDGRHRSMKATPLAEHLLGWSSWCTDLLFQTWVSVWAEVFNSHECQAWGGRQASPSVTAAARCPWLRGGLHLALPAQWILWLISGNLSWHFQKRDSCGNNVHNLHKSSW